jgi:acetylserotonin N-methyltransferase
MDMTTSSPAPVLDLIEAFRRSKTMFAAVELGIFDGRRPAEYRELTRLLDACCALGLLERENGIYRNTPVADEYLRSDSPRTLTGYIKYSNRALYPMWGHLEDAVREGAPRWKQTFGLDGPIFDSFFRDDASKREFLLGMHGFGQISSPAVAAAFDLSSFRRLVDLGGASGHLAKAIAARYPAMDCAVFDLPAVAAEFPGVIAGNFFTDPLPPADLYALSRILHDWSEEKIALLLRRVFTALPNGGALLVAEKILDEDPPGPVAGHMQSLNMLVCTEGRERTLSQYRELLEDAGFTDVQGRKTGTLTDALLARKAV